MISNVGLLTLCQEIKPPHNRQKGTGVYSETLFVLENGLEAEVTFFDQ
jgi:hypothetical protein